LTKKELSPTKQRKGQLNTAFVETQFVNFAINAYLDALIVTGKGYRLYVNRSDENVSVFCMRHALFAQWRVATHSAHLKVGHGPARWKTVHSMIGQMT
jgi:hypothetical protein